MPGGLTQNQQRNAGQFGEALVSQRCAAQLLLFPQSVRTFITLAPGRPFPLWRWDCPVREAGRVGWVRSSADPCCDLGNPVGMKKLPAAGLVGGQFIDCVSPERRRVRRELRDERRIGFVRIETQQRFEPAPGRHAGIVPFGTQFFPDTVEIRFADSSARNWPWIWPINRSTACSKSPVGRTTTQSAVLRKDANPRLRLGLAMR